MYSQIHNSIMKENNLLISTEQSVRLSSVYIGYLVLDLLKKTERVSIFDLYNYLKKENYSFNYANIIYALIFLYVNNLIDFDEPYIYRISK